MNNIKGISVVIDGSNKRLAIQYDVVDEETGKVVKSNKRINRVIVDEDAKEAADKLYQFAQTLVDEN